jgi:drug/metabolite transporter (DMT)-like permease
MNYLFLILGLISLGSLGILHKCADFVRCRPSAVNLFLFTWAALLSGAYLGVTAGVGRAISVPTTVIAVGGICGAVSSVAILTLQRALQYGLISTSWLIINLSTAIPTALSVVIYKEQLGTRQGLSLLLVVLALLLLWWDRRIAEVAASEKKESRSPAEKVGSGV